MRFQAHPGDILAGKYRVDRVLGIGGMGMVVAATHLELDQPVALKFMLGELETSPALLDRFLREARVVAKLRGEHVCRLHDVGRLENGSPYIVMELLNGEDFASLLSREGALEPQTAVAFMMQAIEGVAEAHAEGIVHRDLKPGNLFITTDRDGTPVVKVLDFGISKSASAPATRTGDILGSPGYMAPEQMSNSKETDARADVWSLGVILYQVLSNRMPWEAESLPALCMSIVMDPPPPLPDAIPEGLRAVVIRCLEKEKADRFANVADLAAALVPYGSADAGAVATRISKVIDSAMRPARSTPLPSANTTEQATAVARPARIAPVSTFPSNAAEITPAPTPRARKSWWIVAAGGVVLAGGIAVAFGFGGGSGDKHAASAPTSPAPSPMPSTTLAPPVPPPVAPTAAPVTSAPPPSSAAPPKSATAKPVKRSTIAKPTIKPAETKPLAKPAETKPDNKPKTEDIWNHMTHDKAKK